MKSEQDGALNQKHNYELRFFFTPGDVRIILSLWKKEGRQFKAYSFTDYYFSRDRRNVKIRRWHSNHKPRIEVITFQRKRGLKTESSRPEVDLRKALKKLLDRGFEKNLVICKKKAWLVSAKGMPTYAIEFIPEIGWTGELEVPQVKKREIRSHIEYLKRNGAFGFTKQSMLQIMKSRKTAQFHN